MGRASDAPSFSLRPLAHVDRHCCRRQVPALLHRCAGNRSHGDSPIRIARANDPGRFAITGNLGQCQAARNPAGRALADHHAFQFRHPVLALGNAHFVEQDAVIHFVRGLVTAECRRDALPPPGTYQVVGRSVRRLLGGVPNGFETAAVAAGTYMDAERANFTIVAEAVSTNYAEVLQLTFMTRRVMFGSGRMPPERMLRTIKRYENRKLYDVQAKRYVCLRDVAEIIRAGNDVAVIDNATGEDLTAQTLTKVIADGAGRSPLLPTQYLHDVVRWGGDHLEHWIDRLRSAVERTGTSRAIRDELTQLRERLTSLEALVNELEKEEMK